MTTVRVEEIADQLIASDAALAGALDRKGKRTTRIHEIPGIVEETRVGGGTWAPRWLLVAFVIGTLLVVVVGGGIAFDLFGTAPGPTMTATPTPQAALTPTPTVGAVESPTPTASPSATPAELTFPLDTIFDGCIVIDPQGNTTILAAAFTLFNVESGEYRGMFRVAPGGSLAGSGTATNGRNPIVVPMRATSFGTYDRLVLLAPSGMELALGPLSAQLPLDLNAQTDVRNACDPAHLVAPTQQALAGRAYLQAVAPVNAAAGDFAAATANWTSATPSEQAQADASALLAALRAVQPQLLVLAAAYPPAAALLRAVNGAVDVLVADLTDLSRLDAIGVAAWLERYHAHLGALASASNLVREDLGLAAVSGP